MTALKILADLSGRGVQIKAEGDQLRYGKDAPHRIARTAIEFQRIKVTDFLCPCRCVLFAIEHQCRSALYESCN